MLIKIILLLIKFLLLIKATHARITMNILW